MSYKKITITVELDPWIHGLAMNGLETIQAVYPKQSEQDMWEGLLIRGLFAHLATMPGSGALSCAYPGINVEGYSDYPEEIRAKAPDKHDNKPPTLRRH